VVFKIDFFSQQDILLFIEIKRDGVNRMNTITLYTKDNCPQCKMTKKFLADKNLSFEEINIDVETQYIDSLKEKGFRSVPVITTADEKVTIVGFRPDQLRTLAV
jgi:glutaredoxin-like protein NrdH